MVDTVCHGALCWGRPLFEKTVSVEVLLYLMHSSIKIVDI
jgi:hypothetical protein